ncbi:hypothetical protein [Rhodococcus sp. MALMAid1271]|uniref:hypothetical protein n=1 Tax=Rhodococcus sp. MALMAid1271 TaxID=3411744 RepID=UPI000AC79D07
MVGTELTMKLAEDSPLCSVHAAIAKIGAEVERTLANAPSNMRPRRKLGSTYRNSDAVLQVATQRAADGSDDECKND